jgi:hypothetical protein
MSRPWHTRRSITLAGSPPCLFAFKWAITILSTRGTSCIRSHTSLHRLRDSTLGAQQFAQLLSATDEPGSLYQVALEREGDMDEADWDVSSAKAVRRHRYHPEPRFRMLICLRLVPFSGEHIRDPRAPFDQFWSTVRSGLLRRAAAT